MIRKGAVLVCAVGMLSVPAHGLHAAHAAPADPAPSQSAGPDRPGVPSQSERPLPDTPLPLPPGAGAERDEDSGDGSGDGSGTDGQEAADAARLEQLRARIEDLHDQVGSATDAYNAAVQRVERQQKAVDRLARKLDRNEGELTDLSNQAGAMARAQYRGGGMPPGRQLVLEQDPDRFLHSLSLMYKGQRATDGLLRELRTTRNTLTADARRAHAQWKKLEAGRKKLAAAKKKVEERLEKAVKLESQLASGDRARLRELEEQTSYQRQMRWLKSGVLDEISGKASPAGKQAIAYATAQIGKDYRWGATGPRTFDCSGLTLRAWEAAGTTIPRTSQEQWKSLHKVDLKDMRPGDLIIYKNDASHVGLYVGDGSMVHAPRTGRQVRIEGVGALPVLGVVRPDA